VVALLQDIKRERATELLNTWKIYLVGFYVYYSVQFREDFLLFEELEDLPHSRQVNRIRSMKKLTAHPTAQISTGFDHSFLRMISGGKSTLDLIFIHGLSLSMSLVALPVSKKN
jgi:hypothetical protein